MGQIRHIIANKNIPADYALRIGVRGGGCAGLGFVLGFDKPKTGDDTYTLDELRVLVEKKHTMYLIGLLVDWQDPTETEAGGFLFVNPEALARETAAKQVEAEKA